MSLICFLVQIDALMCIETEAIWDFLGLLLGAKGILLLPLPASYLSHCPLRSHTIVFSSEFSWERPGEPGVSSAATAALDMNLSPWFCFMPHPTFCPLKCLLLLSVGPLQMGYSSTFVLARVAERPTLFLLVLQQNQQTEVMLRKE